MIDLGIIQLELEVINVIIIVTAMLLAANYIGYNIIAAIGGLVAVIYGIRVGAYGEELVLFGHSFAPYEGWLLSIVGGIMLFFGTSSFSNGKDVNTWK